MGTLSDLLGIGAPQWREIWEVLRVVIDVVIVYYIIYRMLQLIKGTQAVQMLLGLAVIILLFILSKEEHFNFGTLNWILDRFLGTFLFLVIVIFQADIRRALAQVGKNPIFRRSSRPGAEPYLEEVVKGLGALSQKRIGALVAIEREGTLDAYAENGVGLDAKVTHEALQSIFIPFKQNPLHDGAVVIREGRIVAARCILPFSTNPRYHDLGSRHRAALGLSELTDAIVVVVSEETGQISLAMNGDITPGLDTTSLRLQLTQGFSRDVSEVRQRLRRSGPPFLQSGLFKRTTKKGRLRKLFGGGVDGPDEKGRG